LEFLSNEEIVLAAKRNLSQFAWDYLTGGAESETTLRRNRLAFDRWAFRPRVLRDVSRIDTSTTLLGHRLRSPVILAPIGSMQHLSPDGAIGFARAAAEYGTIMTHAQTTRPSLEDVASASDAPKVFQLYVMGDEAWLGDLLQRVRAAGYEAICLTVDTPYHSRRDRSILNPAQRAGPERQRHGPNYLAAVTWDTLDRVKDMAGLPFMLKGVTSAEDASLAVEHGVDVVWVSNHGGRQLDHALGTMDVLPEVVEAVRGRAQIVLDSGVQRGGDVLKALALGANALAIGKLQGWGMAAGGPEGVVRVLELLEHEMVSAMGLLGVNCIDELNPSYLTRAEPVTPPHEMSAWVNMPGCRVL
jgi:glycolate oxidase